MQSVVVGPVHERLTRTQQGGGVDRDHHRPFEALGAVDGDELDGVALGVDTAFIAGCSKAPIVAEVADEAFQAFDPIRPRPFEDSLHVGGGARAAMVFARTQDRRYRQTLRRFGKQQGRRGRPCATMQILQSRQGLSR